ncbi:NAD(P)H-hydrate dehydratase [Alkalimarinus coralli]|uniref:NAD(P)H-hydrate dehydratase n=1 Tax=Alkalimarinus coralli TaxID=2935863 RepID=UPI00202B2CF0|nr:NAD(P)H-hydrate dehydratase [Alkalimarinus coralli]
MNRESGLQLSAFKEPFLPTGLYTAKQVRELDKLAIDRVPIEGFALMKKAGRAAFRRLLRHWPEAGSLSVFCGGGNNGGDGLVIAGLAAQKGITVKLVLLAEASSLKGEAASAWQWLQQRNEFQSIDIETWPLSAELECDVIVDCLLGTGLTGKVRNKYAEAIDAINASGKPVFAVDIPSGLCSDTGRVLGSAVKAQRTITFIGLKQGLLTADAPDYVGGLEFDALDVPEAVFNEIEPGCLRADWKNFKTQLPRRNRNAHKGVYGRVLVVGGDYGMAGAALMAAEAVARAGAGLVYVATRPEHVAPFVARCPELMVRGIEEPQVLESLLENIDVIVIGPGLGQGAWGQQLFQLAMKKNKSMVIDADGLNILAALNITPRDNWILTPHPGEAARLLACSVNCIEKDRFRSVVDLQKKYGGSCILKGTGTLLAINQYKTELSDTTVWLANTGNPGMASGGMGDVLSGIIGGLLAQKGIDLSIVAPAAVTLHGEAANLASVSMGEYSLLASDVLNAIPLLLKDI